MTNAPANFDTGMNYVWDWWKFHAEQRTTTFNYFLIITGILANAYVSVVQNGEDELAIGISVVGLLGSIVFLFLDIRNRIQLKAANFLLQQMEPSLEIPIDKFESSDDSDIKKRKHLAEIGGRWYTKHAVGFRVVEGVIAAGWLLTLIVRIV